MNAFYNHHQDNIRFSYRCFDRIVLNGLIHLRERSKLGPHVRPFVPLLPLLSARLPESTALVGAATPGTENRLPATLQRLPEME